MRNARSAAALGLLALLGSALSGLRAQNANQSASALVKFLTDASRRPEIAFGIFMGCGTTEDDRKDDAAAESLVQLGTAALPAIEGEFERWEAQGEEAGPALNEWLLLHADARVRGPAALPRLRALIDNPRLNYLQTAVSDAAANSLGLTSYITHRPWTAMPTFPPVLCEYPTLKGTLDQFILAWEADDGDALEKTLGPGGQESLKTALNGGDWAAMRSHIWPAGAPRAVAVGYRWSEVEAASEEQKLYNGAASDSDTGIETQFQNGAGGDCGASRIRFVAVQDSVRTEFGPVPGQMFTTYRLESANILDLLRLISSCAAE